jgi:serine/threonine protein kinase
MTNKATEKFLPGTLIDGRYDIREHLGQGGMGSVYRAHDTKIGQMVALKMMTGGDSQRSNDDRRMRFAREIVAINGVRHPNVLHIQEFGFHKDTPYMVMELLEGRDLTAVLRESSSPLDIEYTVDIMLAVCAAIRACHASQVIHRDLKPSNIMIVRTDAGAGWDVKVVDFGIAKTIGAFDVTQAGRVMGTPHFLAPEQLAGKVVPASDQYAIGLLLYVCLTRQHPFTALDGPPYPAIWKRSCCGR